MNIQEAIVTRDKHGYWTHPALEKEFSVLENQEHLTDKDFFSLEKNLGGKILFKDIFDEISEEQSERLCSNDTNVVSEWNPIKPYEDAILLSIHSTEDGVVAWWLTSKIPSENLADKAPTKSPVESLFEVPKGFVLMPVEPTDEIVEAIAYSANCCGGIADDIYQAILQTVQKQLPNDQASEKPQSNAFLSAVADMAQKVSSGEYVLVPVQLPESIAFDFALKTIAVLPKTSDKILRAIQIKQYADDLINAQEKIISSHTLIIELLKNNKPFEAWDKA